jgi:hypothetical protein
MVCPTFTSKASACRTMEINAVGNFPAGSWSARTSTCHFSLHLSLSTYFKHVNCFKLLHNCFCVVELLSLNHEGRCVTLNWPLRKTASAFCETNSIEQGAYPTESSTRYMSAPTRMSVSLTSRRACSRSLWMNRRPRLLRAKANCMI